MRPPLRDRKFADSSLEGNGFEISVPRCRATANSVGAFISADEWRLLEPPKLLYRFAEADDRSGDSAAPTVGRPQHDRSLDTAAYLARNNFESIPLQRRVHANQLRLSGHQAARDVGQALAKNPVALIIPRHRVLAAGAGLRFFGARRLG